MQPSAPLSFKALLKQHRRAAGLTQDVLAGRIGYSVSHIRALEQGHRMPPPATAELLAKALGLAGAERAAFLEAGRRASGKSAPGRPAAGGGPDAPPSPAVAAPAPLGPPDDAALLPAPARFVGRTAELAWLEDRLRAGGTSAITALRGMGGIGKTTLAAVAVRQLQAEGRFPDGIAVVFCQGLADPAEALRRVLIRFDPERRAPEATELRRLRDLAQATLRDKRALVVLDNVEPALDVTTVVAPLRAATLLLIARQALPGEAVPPEASRALDLLGHEAALELFAASLGRDGASVLTPAERAAADVIVRDLGRHTLAVKLAGAYAASERRDLEVLARELADPACGLELPGDDGTPEALRRSFALSLEALPPEARRLFAGLAAFATPECGRRAALALGAALGQGHPERGLHLLLVRALVEPSTAEALPAASDRERLRLHPLLRALAEERSGVWPAAERDAVCLAVARHLAGYAQAHQADFGVLAADEGNLMGALEWAQAHDHLALVADLAHGMREFWRVRARYREGVRYLAWGVAAADATLLSQGSPASLRQAAELYLLYGRILAFSGRAEAGMTPLWRSLEVCRQAGDRRGEGIAFTALSEVALLLGQYQASEEYTEQGLAIAREVGNRHGEGMSLAGLGQLALVRGQYDVAEAILEQALAIRREIGARRGEGTDLSYLGDLAAARGQFEVSRAYLEQAVAVAREVGHRDLEGRALGLLGKVALRRAQHEATESYLRQSLAIRREIGDRNGEGNTLYDLGFAAWLNGRHEAAAGYLQQSLAIDREVGDPQTEAVTLQALGRVALRRGQYDAAEGYLRRAMTSARNLGDRNTQAAALSVLGEVALACGRDEAAQGYLRQAQAIRREIGNRHGEGVDLIVLGQVALRRGQLEDARGYLEQAVAIHREAGDPYYEARGLCGLGRVAEALDDTARAEALYRTSLALATERDLGPETAQVQLALGRLLAELPERREEGCRLLRKAARRFAEMGMPEAEEARMAAGRLGCADDTA